MSGVDGGGEVKDEGVCFVQRGKEDRRGVRLVAAQQKLGFSCLLASPRRHGRRSSGGPSPSICTSIRRKR